VVGLAVSVTPRLLRGDDGRYGKNLPGPSIAQMMEPVIYILASRRNGSLYIGVTSDIRRRLAQHRDGKVAHTQRYRIGHLVYFEWHDTIDGAIAREKRLKKWRRAWKVALIEAVNPTWDDLTLKSGW